MVSAIFRGGWRKARARHHGRVGGQIAVCAIGRDLNRKCRDRLRRELSRGHRLPDSVQYRLPKLLLGTVHNF